MPVAAIDKKKSNKCLKARKSNLKIKLCHVGHELPHCVKSVQIRSFFWSLFSRIRTKYGPENTPYLDTFHAVPVYCKTENVFRLHLL